MAFVPGNGAGVTGLTSYTPQSNAFGLFWTPANGADLTTLTYVMQYRRQCDFTWTYGTPAPFLGQGTATQSFYYFNVASGMQPNTIYQARIMPNGGRWCYVGSDFRPVYATTLPASGTTTESPDGTVIGYDTETNPPPAGTFIIDSHGDLYQMTNNNGSGTGKSVYYIAQKGVLDQTTTDTINLIYSNHKVYRLDKFGNFFSKGAVSENWVADTDPRLGAPPLAGINPPANYVADTSAPTVVSFHTDVNQNACKISVIFAGPAWANGTNNISQTTVYNALNTLITGGYHKTLAEYHIFQPPVLVGQFNANAVPPTNPKSTDNEAVITALLNNGTLTPPAAENHLFLILYDQSVANIGGAHSQLFYNGNLVYYAYVTPGNGTTPNYLDWMTAAANHEICEHITDPGTLNWNGYTNAADSQNAPNAGYNEICDYWYFVNGAANFSVRQFNGVGVYGFFSNRLNQYIIPTQAPVSQPSGWPPAPQLIPGGLAAVTNIIATSSTTNSISLSWGASDGSGVSYNIFIASSSSGPFTLLANVTGTTYTATNLANGSSYYFNITAVNSYAISQATISPALATQGSIPAGYFVDGNGANLNSLQAYGASTTAMYLQWFAPPNAPTSLTYLVQYRRLCDFTWNYFGGGPQTPVFANGLSVVQVTGLQPYTSYVFRVKPNGSRWAVYVTGVTTAVNATSESPDGYILGAEAATPQVPYTNTPNPPITDRLNNAYSLMFGTDINDNNIYYVGFNGTIDATAPSTINLYMINHTIYRQDKNLNWTSKVNPGDAWTVTTDPRIGAPPKPSLPATYGQHGTSYPNSGVNIPTVISWHGNYRYAFDYNKAQVTVIYYGPTWNTNNDPTQAQLSPALHALFNGPYFLGCTEYYLVNKPVLVNEVTVALPCPSVTQTNYQQPIEAAIIAMFDNGTLTVPTTDNHIFFIHFDNTMNFTGGYHSMMEYKGLPIAYATAFFSNYTPTAPINQLNTRTATTSHETLETLNDWDVTFFTGREEGTSTFVYPIPEPSDAVHQFQFNNEGIYVDSYWSNLANQVITPLTAAPTLPNWPPPEPLVPGAIPPVTGITQTSVTPTSMVISWASPESGTYNVSFGTSASGPFTFLTSLPGTIVNITGLQQNTVYYFSITIQTNTAISIPTISGPLSTTQDAPPAVTGLAVSGSTFSSLTVVWNAVPASFPNVTYLISVGLSATSLSGAGSATASPFTISNLNSGVNYFVGVQAQNAGGTSPLATAGPFQTQVNAGGTTFQSNFTLTSS